MEDVTLGGVAAVNGATGEDDTGSMEGESGGDSFANAGGRASHDCMCVCAEGGAAHRFMRLI